MAAMTPDCVFESTTHRTAAGTRARSRAGRLGDFFAGSPHAHFDAEEVIVAGDRAIVQWRYRGTTATRVDPRCGPVAGPRRPGGREARYVKAEPLSQAAQGGTVVAPLAT